MAKRKTIVGDIIAVLEAGGHVMGDQHREYHPARAARDAKRCRSPLDRLTRARAAVKNFRVRVELTDGADLTISTMNRSHEVTF